MLTLNGAAPAAILRRVKPGRKKAAAPPTLSFGRKGKLAAVAPRPEKVFSFMNHRHAIERDLPIRTYDIDFAGIVSNIVYVRWLEDLRLAMMEEA